VRGVVVTLRDVTEQRRLEQELTRWAFHDPLTGLPNRRFFDDRVAHAIATDRGITGVVAIDLDDFKLVNDRLGNELGDAALMAVAGRLRETVGEEGFPARRGGDEFGVLLQNLTSVDAVKDVATRICQSLAEPMSIGGSRIACSVSIGAATTLDPVGRQSLLGHADLALHVAKESGRGNWRLYEPSMRSAIMDRLDLSSSLSRAVDEGALSLEYQPIVALQTRRIVGFEALLRWDHPSRGRLLPGDFIDIAEEAGLISRIGDWVLITAMTAAAGWTDAAPDSPPYVGVNVSAQQFRSPGFVDRVYHLCDESGLPPHRLLLEITESLFLRDDDVVWQDLTRLRRWGVRVAIDDFGTGYSALSYLRQVPLDVVKLDRTFTISMASSSRQRHLVEGIVKLTQALDLEVVAEGVETEHERQLAAAIGCTLGQGYLFARPMPEAAVLGWLRADPIADRRGPRADRQAGLVGPTR
jgi:diguanylate cyclase (GGDEF)-like protein